MIDEKLTQLDDTLEKHSKIQREKRKAEIAVIKEELEQIKKILKEKLGFEVKPRP